MSRVRLVLVSMLAVLAFGAVASASASAHKFFACLPSSQGGYEDSACSIPAGTMNYAKAYVSPSTGNWLLCLKGGTEFTDPMCTTLGSGPFFLRDSGIKATVTGTSGESILEGEVALVKVFIKCKKDTFSGELEATGASKGKVEFTECRVVNKKGNQIENCKVKEPIEFKFKDQLVGTTVEDEFKPAAGTIFVEITMEAEAGGVCAISGTYKVEGTQTCKLPSAGTLQAEHEIVCEPSGSSLKFAGNPATFTSTEKVKLESGGSWAIE